MKNEDLKELYYITHIDNLSSIFNIGILSHNKSKLISHKSVSLKEVQQKREKKVVPNGKPLHDYVNLYINCRNTMMYTVKNKNPIDQICVLGLKTSVLDLPNIILSDQNAASDYVRFYEVSEGLAKLDHDYIFSKYWRDQDDPIEEMRHKSAMCAELLVYENIKPEYIQTIYTACDKLKIEGLGINTNIEINPYLFFM